MRKAESTHLHDALQRGTRFEQRADELAHDVERALERCAALQRELASKVGELVVFAAHSTERLLQTTAFNETDAALKKALERVAALDDSLRRTTADATAYAIVRRCGRTAPIDRTPRRRRAPK